MRRFDSKKAAKVGAAALACAYLKTQGVEYKKGKAVAGAKAVKAKAGAKGAKGAKAAKPEKEKPATLEDLNSDMDRCARARLRAVELAAAAAAAASAALRLERGCALRGVAVPPPVRRREAWRAV